MSQGGGPPLFGITEAAINAAAAIFPSGPVPLTLLGGGKKKKKKASKKRRKRSSQGRRTRDCRCAPRCKCKSCKCTKKRPKRKSRRRVKRTAKK